MNSRGFTLIELLVTLTVFVLLATVAIPSYSEFRKRQDIISVKNEVHSLLSAARGEAVKRRVDVIFELGEESGWPVTVKYVESGAEVVIAERVPRNNSVSLAWGSDGDLVFNRHGRAEEFKALCLKYVNGDQSREIQVLRSGQVDGNPDGGVCD